MLDFNVMQMSRVNHEIKGLLKQKTKKLSMWPHSTSDKLTPVTYSTTVNLIKNPEVI